MLEIINKLFSEFHGIAGVIMSIFYGISKIASVPAIVAEGADDIAGGAESVKDNLAYLYGTYAG